MGWSDYFPYEPRLDQEPIAEFVSKNIIERGIAIVEAPYGIGKSIAMLSAALASGKKVVFATCNNASHNSIIDEVLKINIKLNKNLTVASLIGKGKLCLQDDFSYDLCEQLRKDKLCKYYEGTYGKDKAEKAMSKAMTTAVEEVEMTVKKRGYELLHKPFPQFVNSKALEHQVCPYELMLKLGERADVVTVDFFHIFTNLLKFSKKRLGIDMKETVLFVDEADELKNRMLSALTKQVSALGIQRLRDQVKKTPGIKDDDVQFIDNFLETFKELFDGKENYFDLDRQAIIGKFETAFGDLEQILDRFSDIIGKVGKAFERVASRPDVFFDFLLRLPNDQFCYGHKGENKESLMISHYELFDATLMEMDGLQYKMKDIFEDFHASILFSATIGNVEIFKKGIGIEFADFFSSNKFNTDNFKVILKRDISSLYRNRKDTAPKVVEDVKFCNDMSGGVLLAMPSKASGYDIVPHLEGARDLDVVRDCKSGGIYYAVLGGKSSRGINKARDLNMVYIYGLQLPQLTDYLFIKRRDYMLSKYSKETAYKYLYSNIVSKACQIAGRIFRNKDKKGLVVFADSRYRYDFMQRDFFYNCFPGYFKEKMIETNDQKTFQSTVSNFWGKLPFQF